MLKTDGMDRDPISGNDVPLGSTAKEVRDDVDARLSEGEYVLPADVVRFFGLEKIEEMVSVAKEGIQEMGAKGRIGGEPASMGDEEMMAQADKAFNQGGVVPGAPTGVPGSNAPDIGALLDSAKSRAERDPEFAQLLESKGISIRKQTAPMSKPPSNNMGAPVAMNEGGAVFGQTPYNPADFRSNFNPYGHTPGFMGTAGSGVGESEDPSKMCGPGTVWDEEKKVCVLATPMSTTPPPIRNDDGGGPATPQGDPNAWMKKFDYSNPETLYEQTMNTLGVEEDGEEKGGLLGALGGLLEGGILGKFTATTSAAQAMANARVLRAQGREDLADKIEAQYSTFVEEKGISMIPETWRDGDRLAEDIMEVHGTTITGWGSKTTGTGLGAKTTPDTDKGPAKASDTAISQASSMHDSIAKKGKTGYSGNTETLAGRRNIQDKAAQNKAKDSSAKYHEVSAISGESIAEQGRSAAPSSASRSTSQQARDEGDPRNMNRGGLVQRRKK